MRWLAFADRRQERQWEHTQAADQAGLDAAVSIQTLLFPSLVARTLWDQLTNSPGGVPRLETLWLAIFLGWALLHLLLAQLCPGTYLRYRTPIVLLSRLQRQLTIMRYAALFNREAMGLAGAATPVGALPATLGGVLGMLLWRPGSVASLLSTYTLPLKYTAPCALLLLCATLHSTLSQCAADCHGAAHAQAADMYAGLVQRLRGGLSWARRGGASSPAGACLGTPPGGAGGGTCSAAGCMGACVAVHGWLQVVLGALLPLAVMWAVEERSRLRFQQQWLQHHVVVGEEGGDDAASSRGGATSASGAQQQRSAAGAAKLLPPVPGVALAAWLAASSWALWRVFEILVL